MSERYAVIDTDFIIKALIHRYSDEDIVSELVPYYGQLTVAVCIEYLRKSCLPFGMELEKNFPNTIRSLKEGTREYLNTLKCDCDNIGSGNNLGEIKSYMLIQLLKFLNGLLPHSRDFSRELGGCFICNSI